MEWTAESQDVGRISRVFFILVIVRVKKVLQE